MRRFGSADDTANNKELNAKLKLENEKFARELKEAKDRNEKLEAFGSQLSLKLKLKKWAKNPLMITVKKCLKGEVAT